MRKPKARQGQAAARAKAGRDGRSSCDPRPLFACGLRSLRRRRLTYAATACAVAATVAGVIAVAGGE
ncbi:hypothetical protein [Streptomyces sp. JH34]|uniref:hypothetical protein n=1 Tax=Streptomyces sp. JH34 TaxID=2793633 RepID=UPI0023F83748|nr:hypothetical protein [Streptomyces sp. JH34]MDF6018164.1 hypothetical protein [Streptomyces sp. JH34]